MDSQTSQPADAGNAVADTSALDTNQAAAVLANLLGDDGSVNAEPEKQEPSGDGEDGQPPKPPAEEGANPDDPKPDEKKFTVKIDGKDVEISESELVNGYQAQKSSTQKFEAASQLRKEAETQQAQARQERQQYAHGLAQAQAALNVALTEQSKIDWHALRESDPVEFLKQQHLFQERQVAFQQNQQRQAQLNQIETTERTKSFVEFVHNEQQALLAKLPEWKDEKKASADKARISEFLQSELGFKQEEIFTQHDQQGNVVKPGLADHRILLMAYNAMRYGEVMGKAREAAKKVQAVPQRTVVPDNGSVSIDKRGAQFQQLKKSGSPRDAVGLMSQFIN